MEKKFCSILIIFTQKKQSRLRPNKAILIFKARQNVYTLLMQRIYIITWFQITSWLPLTDHSKTHLTIWSNIWMKYWCYKSTRWCLDWISSVNIDLKYKWELISWQVCEIQDDFEGTLYGLTRIKYFHFLNVALRLFERWKLREFLFVNIAKKKTICK